jgi:hypothetical protein
VLNPDELTSVKDLLEIVKKLKMFMKSLSKWDKGPVPLSLPLSLAKNGC